jgi:23S rRNA (cytosine1962-C5)-methyltransferase
MSNTTAESHKRLATRISSDALRQLRGGHPWIYDEAINSISSGGKPGDFAVVFDDKKRFAAIGLFDPRSPIRIKIIHAGKPETIDETFWRRRLTDALNIRRDLINEGGTTGYRVLNGENDGMPGFIIDRYADTLVLKIYTEAWFVHLPMILPIIESVLAPTCMVLRLARSVTANLDASSSWHDGQTLLGDAPTEPVLFMESGLTFEADVIKGQKTGHFLDQRDNRQLVGERSRGARVLDVFASTGGFTVYAAAGGATEVHSVDLSSPTLAVAKRNLEHNAARTSKTKHTSISGDAFGVLAGMGAQNELYDIVVVDPPSFAQRQHDVFDAIAAYRRLAQLAVRVVRPGGMLVSCSCSSRVTAGEFFDAVHDGAEMSGIRLREDFTTDHGVDHPVSFRQGAYLKAMYATVG